MAGTKEIRRRLASVRSTRKITSAMKLVSAAKLRRAQDSVTRSRAYTTALNELLAELRAEAAGLDMIHPLMEARVPAKRALVIVIGGSRGLCGAYNGNIGKRIESLARERAGQETQWLLIGRKPGEHCRRVGREYLKSYEELPEDANRWPVDEFAADAERAFLNGEVDEVFVLYARFKSAMSMTVTLDQILPLGSKDLGADDAKPTVSGLSIFEPSVQELFAAVLPRIVRSKLRQAGLDAKASEYASRMTAMESATKNAGDLAKKLQLTYNKVRQSGITSELLDIIGGAEAIKG